jgi:hypothetical protein
MQAGVPQGSGMSPTPYNLYINDTPQTHGVHLAIFAGGTCLYATKCKEGYVLRKLQHSLNSVASCCDRWNVKINEEKIRTIYFSHRIRQPVFLLPLNGRDIPFLNSIKYLGVIFDKKITWRLYIETIEANRNDRSQGLQNIH